MPEKNKGTKIYFDLRFQQLAISLSLRRGRISWQLECVMEEVTHLMAAGEQRVRERDQG
jgi:hypothetical protein